MHIPKARVGKLQALAIAVGAFAFSCDALATCGCQVTLVNGADSGKVTISKIKTSDTGIKADIFKNQWTGTRQISAGKKSTFDFTVDGKCGNDHWFKFIRQDGKNCTHRGPCGSRQTCKPDEWQ